MTDVTDLPSLTGTLDNTVLIPGVKLGTDGGADTPFAIGGAALIAAVAGGVPGDLQTQLTSLEGSLTMESETLGGALDSLTGTVSTLGTAVTNVVGSLTTITFNLGSISSMAEGALPASSVGVTVAPLVSGTVPLANLPAAIVGAVHYLGVWNAATNTPTITSGTAPPDGLVGGYYVCDNAGTISIDAENVFAIGDWIVWDGTVWNKLQGQVNPVSSVAGRQGAVVLSAGDISGLGNAAVSNFGTTSGTVADGALLAIETSNRATGDTANANAITSLASTVTSNTTSLTALGSLVASGATNTAITAETERAEGIESGLGTAITNTNSTLTLLAGTVTSHTTSLTALGTEFSNLSGTVTSNTTSLSALGGSVTSNTTSLTALGTSVGTLNSEVAANTTSLTTLGGSVTSNTTSLTALGTEFSNLSGTVTSNTTSLTSLGGSVTSNTTSLTSLGGSVTSNTTSLTSLGGSVTSHTTSLTALGTEFSNLSGTVTSNTTSLSALGGSVTSNTTSLTSLGGSVTSNTTSLTTLGSNLGTETSNRISGDAANAAAIVSSTVTAATISGAGTLTLSTGNGSITAGGSVMPVIAAGTQTTGVSGSQPVLNVSSTNPGTYSLSFVWPPGPAGATSFINAASGIYNALTNTPAITSSGGGASANTVYFISKAGTVSADSVGAVLAGGFLTNMGGTWSYVPYSGTPLAGTSLGLTNCTVQDNGDNIWGFKWVDNAGQWWAAVDAVKGLQAPQAVFGAVTATTAAIGSLTVGSFVNPLVSTYLQLTRSTMVDNGDGIWGYKWVDNAGQWWMAVDAIFGLQAPQAVVGTARITNLIVTGTYTGPASTVVGADGQVLQGTNAALSQSFLAGLTTEAGTPGHLQILLPDRKLGFDYNAVTGVLWTAGGFQSPTSASTTVFGAADFAAHDASNLAYSAGVRATGNITAQRPVAPYNLYMCYGQSKGMGELGSPSLTTNQPLDNLMIGSSQRCIHPIQGSVNNEYLSNGVLAYTTNGSAAFEPLVSADQNASSGALATAKVGVLTGVGPVTVTIGGGQGTFTCAGENFPAQFVSSDTLQMAGFGVATGNNYSNSNCNTFTVVSSVVGTLVVAEGSQCVATTSAESGIEFAHVSFNNFGESTEVTAVNTWRALNLNQKQLASDPSRKFVSMNASVSGQTIAALSTTTGTITGGVVVQAPLYQRVTSAVALFESLAGSGNGCITVFDMNQGGGDASGNTPYATYVSEFTAFVNLVLSTILTPLGQTKSPFIFTACVDGSQTWDGPDPAGVFNPITTAQAQMAGCRPIVANGSLVPGAGLVPIVPDLYMIAPDYYTSDHGGHLTGNGYRWFGAKKGRIIHDIIDGGYGWKPMHLINLSYRGNEVLVDLHVPVTPVQIQPFFAYTNLVSYADSGFSVQDASGFRTVVASIPPAKTQVLLTCAGGPLVGPVRVWYADKGVGPVTHGGGGNIADSDQGHSLINWDYLGDGNAQVLGENQPGAITASHPVTNNAPVPTLNWLIPFSELATPG